MATSLRRQLPPLLELPAELVQQILAYLSPESLAAISGTCRKLHQSAADDLLWQTLVQENMPGVNLISPEPFPSFKELYVAHFPCWFLCKQKIWFGDTTAVGSIVVARYNPRRGSIEAYPLVGKRPQSQTLYWEHDRSVIIHTFNPQSQLHMNTPVVMLEPDRTQDENVTGFRPYISLPIVANTRIHSTFMLAKPIPPSSQSPNMALWPPAIIPASQRVRNEPIAEFQGEGHMPKNRAEASDQAFRIRRWVEFGNQLQHFSVRMAESVTTYSTLLPELWTPTKEKPWRGIWVGDYSGHGCEYLLVRQPDDPDTLQTNRGANEGIYHGRLEAIKLTGDPNVPRGEYTWIAEDIGEAGFVREAIEPMFQGARVVKSMGHIAARGFVDEEFIPSQLIMISDSKLAQYWKKFGHISYYERVDIDQFLQIR